MVSINGISTHRLEPAVSGIGRFDSASPVKSKIPTEQNEARAVGDTIADKAAGKQTIRFDQLTEQDKQKLQEELDQHNEKFAYTGKYLKFKFDEEASMMYVEVIDASTQEVIVSLPPEFLIDLSVKIKKILGLYIDEKW